MIETEVKKIVFSVTGTQCDYSPDLSWHSLGVDSLDLLDIITRCELQFRLKVTDLEAGKLFTLGSLVKLINTKTQGLSKPNTSE